MYAMKAKKTVLPSFLLYALGKASLLHKGGFDLCLFQLECARIELIVRSTPFDELIVRAPFYNSAVVKHHNGV